eukprot:XP_765510.1 hypothetical protein [Theileria parva strain Muguga]
MDFSIIVEGTPHDKDNVAPLKKKFSFHSVLNKLLFFLLGSSVTCLGTTGRLTSKAFGTNVFISDCFSVYIYLNLVAFLVVLLFIECSYKKAIVSGWLCFTLHIHSWFQSIIHLLYSQIYTLATTEVLVFSLSFRLFSKKLLGLTPLKKQRSVFF